MYTTNISPLPMSPTSQSKRQSCFRKAPTITLTFWLLVAVLYPPHALAGVIKKREIPFTIDLKPTEMLDVTATTTSPLSTLPNSDPDHETRGNLDKLTATVVSFANSPQLAIDLNAKTEPASATTETSREFQFNEIALNDTKKVIKSLSEDENIGEKVKAIAGHLATAVLSQGNEDSHNDDKHVANLNNQQMANEGHVLENLLNQPKESTFSLGIGQLGEAVKESTNENLEKATEIVKEFSNGLSFNPIHTSNEEKDKTNTHEVKNDFSLVTNTTLPLNPSNIQDDKENLLENKEHSLETTAVKVNNSEHFLSGLLSRGGGGLLESENETHNETLAESLAKSFLNPLLGKDKLILDKENSPNEKEVQEKGEILSTQTEVIGKNFLNGVKLASMKLEKDNGENLYGFGLKNMEETSSPQAELGKISAVTENSSNDHENTLGLENNGEPKVNEEKSPRNLEIETDNSMANNLAQEKSHLEHNGIGNILLDVSSKENIVHKLLNEETKPQEHDTPNNGTIETNENISKIPIISVKEAAEKAKTALENLQGTAVQNNSTADQEVKTTTISLKDHSLETNHISDNAIKSTTEVITAQLEGVFSRNSGNTEEAIKSPVTAIKIQNGLDRDSWQDVSNDLPQNNTEGRENPMDSSKTELGRSMFKNGEDDEQEVTTLPSNNHIANNIDFEDEVEEGEKKISPSIAEGGEGKVKKPKFINDNSTNAQQMNLPTNAEVWSLAGLKPTVMHTNATMATAPKHKQEQAASDFSGAVNKSLSVLNNSQGEKSLLDWSHILANQDMMATTMGYEGALEVESKKSPETMESSSMEINKTAQITANLPTTTILSSMSDNVERDKHDFTMTTTTAASAVAVAAAAAVDMAGETSTEFNEHNNMAGLSSLTTTSSAEIVASPKSVITHEDQQQQQQTLQRPDLNEINLTLNKTTAESENNMPEPNKDSNHSSHVNHNNPSVMITETESQTERVTAVNDDESSTAAANAAKTTTELFSFSSTPETGKVNVTSVTETAAADNIETKTTNAATILENSHKYQENSVNDNEKSLKQKEKLQIFDITTYKPSFKGITSTSSSSSSSTTLPPSFTLETETNKFSRAEVVDQNGNNEIEQKQSINIETTTIATLLEHTTTKAEVENEAKSSAAAAAASSLNNFSSTIKTHLNEQQVLLETSTEFTTTTTTTTATPRDILLATTITTNGTSEEKTTSSYTDEIINHNNSNNEGKEESQLETITTEATTSTTTTPKSQDFATEEGKAAREETESQQNSTASAVITGPLTSSNTTTKPLENTSDKEEHQEVETTTAVAAAAAVNAQQETPVVDNNKQTNTHTDTNESLLPETTTTKSEEDITTTTIAIETTTEGVGTYFKFPIRGDQNKKETITQQELSTSTTTTTQANLIIGTKEDDKEIETSTEIMNSTSSNNLAATQETFTSTTAKEETYISLLDDSTTSTTTTNAPITSTTTTTAIVAENPYTTTTTTTKEGIDISSKIEEIYKVITTSSSTEAIPITTQQTISEEEEEAVLTSTTTTARILLTDSTTTTMLPPITTPGPTIHTADIGGKSLPPLDTILGTNSGNSMYPKNSDNSGETDVNVIIAITVSVIGVVALILLVAFLYLMRKRQKQTSYGGRCRPVSLDEYTIDNGSIGASMRKGSVLRSSKRTYGNLAFDDPSIRHNAMGLHELSKFASEKLRIFEEFRDVPQITAREDEVPQGCEDKNRYANVLPLPETRVVLQRLNDDEKTEYINANYVTGPKDAPNYYIACQAPMDATVEDFWRMIWEQQSRVIIQATDLIENGVEKCAEYLPPSVTLDNHSTFGDFQVTLQNREVKDKYAISTILLKNTGENNATRELTHYWYKWPETGVPLEEAPIIAMLLEARSSLISYAIEQANEDKENKSSSATLKSAEEGTATAVVNGGGGATGKEGGDGSSNGGNNDEINGNISMVPIKKTARNQGPLTVHCSPGTGRTGTIIACDIAIRSLETPKRTVDIPHIVYYVRRGRASAVLTKEQYEFIYKVANMYGAKISNPSSYN
uniref:protein-tyrosine-phosphatase n=1 Tax=Stomoxys calcitrans TaxID=35570 RepID=A0A1I8QC23_STOCA